MSYIDKKEAGALLKAYVIDNFRTTEQAGDFFCCSATHVSNCCSGTFSLTKRMRDALGLTKETVYKQLK